MYFSILFFLHSNFFAHSRQRKLNLFHLGTIFSISFVHLSLKNKKLNLFHPFLNIGQVKGRFCQKNRFQLILITRQGNGPFCKKNLKLNLFNPIPKIRQGEEDYTEGITSSDNSQIIKWLVNCNECGKTTHCLKTQKWSDVLSHLQLMWKDFWTTHCLKTHKWSDDISHLQWMWKDNALFENSQVIRWY